MPYERPLTPEEAANVKSQGIDPTGVTVQVDGEDPNAPKPMSNAGAVVARLKAHAGGDIGAGGLMALGPFNKLGITAGAMIPGLGETGLSELAGGAVGSAVDAYVGSMLGQKAQDMALGDVTTRNLQQGAEEAKQQHPITSSLTDIGSAMLSSGGRPGINTLTGALKGDAQKAVQLGMNTAVNPMINAGIGLAAGQGLPSLSDFAQQAASGLVTDNARWAQKMHERIHGPIPTAEPIGNPVTDEQQQVPLSPYAMRNGAEPIISDNVVKDSFNKVINPKPEPKKYSSIADYDIARSDWGRQKDIPVEDMRKALHDLYISEVAKKANTTTEPLKMATGEEAVVPKVDEKGKEVEPTNVAPETIEQKSQRMLDFQKAQDEEAARHAEPIIPEDATVDSGKPLVKPITENQARIINPNTLLQSDIARPESFDRNKYAPKTNPQTDDYVALNTRMHQLMDAGNIHSPEFQDVFSKLIALQNKNGGMAPVSAHIESGNATVGSVLSHIAASRNNEWSPLAKHLAQVTTPDKLATPIKGGPVDRSRWNPINGITMAPHESNNHDIIMHEIGHALLEKNLPQEFNGLRGAALKFKMDEYLRHPAGHGAVKELIRSYYEAAKQLGVHDALFNDEHKFSGERTFTKEGLAGNPDKAAEVLPHGYAMGDFGEYVGSLLTNKKFQEHLNELPSGDNIHKTLWDRIVGAIRNVLNIPVKEQSLLERALKPVEELVKTPGEGSGKNSGEKFAPKSTSTQQQKTKDIPLTEHLRGTKDLFRSMVDKVAHLPIEGARKLSEAGAKALNEIPVINGRSTYNVVNEGKKLTTADKTQLNVIRDYRNSHGGTVDVPASMYKGMSPAAIKYDQNERKVHTEEGLSQLRDKEPIILPNGQARLLRPLPFAHSIVPSQKVIETLHSNTNKAAIDDIHQKFIDNLTNNYQHTPAEAESKWKDFRDNIQGTIQNTGSNLQHFNAVRRARTVPLPTSLGEHDPVINDERLYQRRAVDRAFWNNIESKHDIMGMLGQQKDVWGQSIKQRGDGSLANNPDVRNMLNEFHGEKGGPGFHAEKALSAATTASFIAGPAIEVHKVASNILGTTLSFADNPQQLLRGTMAMITNFREGLQHATENGLVKTTARSIKTVLDTNATAAERMQSLAAGIRQLSSLGGLSDKLSAGLMQAGMEYSIPLKIEQANKGDVSAQQKLKHLDPDYTVGKTYSQPEIIKLASVAASYIHGTGDGRTMPHWMASDTEFSGFFKLAHWSVAQTNRFMSDIYTPAVQRGQYGPLLTTLFGSAIGGYMIKELREKIQGKSGQIPSLQEIASSEGGLANHKSLVAYNMVAAAQYAGFGGMLSQLARYPFDLAYKNNPQGATFPLDEIATDLAQTVSHVTTAIANDKNIDWLNLATHVANHVLTQNVQLARVGVNQAINSGLVTGDIAEKKQLNDKLGQLRRFNEVQGLPYTEQGGADENPYMDLEQKRFKTTQDVHEAARMLPGLVSSIMTEYRSQPDVMMEKLKALKTHTYATMPSMESMPIEFMKYVAFLKNSEGEEKAHEAVMDYMRHRMIGQVKASMVP